MVKPVVKPHFSLPLDHDLLAFSPFFARLLAFLKTADENHCTLPNVARYQLRHTPKCEKYSIFRSFSVSGQTCGQTTFIEDFAREQSAEKVNVYKASRRFLLLETLGAVSCSQSRRATKCATSRKSAAYSTWLLYHNTNCLSIVFLKFSRHPKAKSMRKNRNRLRHRVFRAVP